MSAQLLVFNDPASRFGLRAVMCGPKKQRRKRNAPDYAYAQPNKMFQDEATATIRYLCYKKPVACASCGKVKKRHWTMLIAFYAINMADARNLLAVHEYGPLHPALTPVCDSHPLEAERESMLLMVGSLRYFYQMTVARLTREAAAKEKAKS